MFKRLLLNIGLILFLFIFLNCTRIVPDAVLSIISDVENKYAPDKRLSVFAVNSKITGDTLILNGQMLSPEAKNELMERLTQLQEFIIKDQIVVLPHPELGEETFGVIRLSTVEVRRTPDYDSEMTSQGTMGSEIRILKKNDINNFGWWRYCQLEDGYLGWLPKSGFAPGDEAFIEHWRNQKKMIVTTNYCQVWENRSENSHPVSDLVRGNKIIKLNRIDDWYEVELPDHREGYVKAIYVDEEDSLLNRPKPGAEEILNTAYSFIGTPYLWGGLSIKGFDCSGFTQTVFKLNDIKLPRDANMQVKEGKEIIIDENFSNLQPVDLLFWGSDTNQITHVGIYIGEKQFIHSDGMVCIDSFDPAVQSYNAYRHRTLQRARRILE